MEKYEYGPGPWSTEPNRIEFESHGFPCLIRRNPLGALCGYVAVPRGHPCHGQSYNKLPRNLEAHGGITYAEACNGEICHVPKPGEPDDVWWIGFDCAHAWDLVPWIESQTPGLCRNSEYRDIHYVRRECEELAAQLEQLK